MSVPAVSRIFFAVDLPESIKDKVNQFINVMKKKAKKNGIRWTRTENLHITLQFLAEFKTEHLDNLIANVRAEIEGIIAATTFRLGEIELLPSPFRPRVIVLGIENQENLAVLSKLIGHGIQATNYTVEDRPFRAHLTLGRIKHVHNPHLKFLTEVGRPDVDEVMVDEVVLFRSDPQPDGSRYLVLERIDLLQHGDNLPASKTGG